MEAGSSLPKPQPIIVPPFEYPTWHEVEKNYWTLKPKDIDLSPALPVPVGYQWQLTSIYLPMLESFQVNGGKGGGLVLSLSGYIQAQLLRDGQVVWVAQTERDFPITGRPNEEEDIFTLPMLLAEDFNNPVVFSPGSQLKLRLEATVLAILPEGKIPTIKIFNLWSGPQAGAPPSGASWPANGILHYSLYTGS